MGILDDLNNVTNARTSLLDRLGSGQSVDPNEQQAVDIAALTAGNEFTKGLRRFDHSMRATTQAFMGQMTESFAPEFAARQIGEAQSTLRDMPQTIRPKYETFEQARKDGLEGLGSYAASSLGEGLPSTAAMAAGALAGGGVGALAGRAALGRALGGIAAMLPMEGGETALQLREDPQAMANTTPAERTALTLGKGLASSIEENAVEQMMIAPRLLGQAAKIAPGFGNAVKNTALLGGAGALGEFGTEATQELTGQAALKFANPQKGYDLNQAVEAGIKGAITGGVLGGAGGVAQGVYSNLPEASTKTGERKGGDLKLDGVIDRLSQFQNDPTGLGKDIGQAISGIGSDLKQASLGVLDDLAAQTGEIKPGELIKKYKFEFDKFVVDNIQDPEKKKAYIEMTSNLHGMAATEIEMLRKAMFDDALAEGVTPGKLAGTALNSLGNKLVEGATDTWEHLNKVYDGFKEGFQGGEEGKQSIDLSRALSPENKENLYKSLASASSFEAPKQNAFRSALEGMSESAAEENKAADFASGFKKLSSILKGADKNTREELETMLLVGLDEPSFFTSGVKDERVNFANEFKEKTGLDINVAVNQLRKIQNSANKYAKKSDEELLNIEAQDPEAGMSNWDPNRVKETIRTAELINESKLAEDKALSENDITLDGTESVDNRTYDENGNIMDELKPWTSPFNEDSLKESLIHPDYDNNNNNDKRLPITISSEDPRITPEMIAKAFGRDVSEDGSATLHISPMSLASMSKTEKFREQFASRLPEYDQSKGANHMAGENFLSALSTLVEEGVQVNPESLGLPAGDPVTLKVDTDLKNIRGDLIVRSKKGSEPFRLQDMAGTFSKQSYFEKKGTKVQRALDKRLYKFRNDTQELIKTGDLTTSTLDQAIQYAESVLENPKVSEEVKEVYRDHADKLESMREYLETSQDSFYASVTGDIDNALNPAQALDAEHKAFMQQPMMRENTRLLNDALKSKNGSRSSRRELKAVTKNFNSIVKTLRKVKDLKSLEKIAVSYGKIASYTDLEKEMIAKEVENARVRLGGAKSVAPETEKSLTGVDKAIASSKKAIAEADTKEILDKILDSITEQFKESSTLAFNTLHSLVNQKAKHLTFVDAVRNSSKKIAKSLKEKDAAKANAATAFMSLGVVRPDSSTARYKEAAFAAGLVKTSLTKDDKVFVSINGSTVHDKAKIQRRLERIFEVGASVLADNSANRSTSYNKNGEGLVATILQEQGYVEVDKGLYSEWHAPNANSNKKGVEKEKVKEKVKEKETSTSTETGRFIGKLPMYYKMPVEGIRAELRSKFPKGTTTAELMKLGFRTATTRNKVGNVGDTFEVGGEMYRITGVEPIDLKSPEGREAWSKKEGWDVDYAMKAYPKQVYHGALQTTFEKIETKKGPSEKEIATQKLTEELESGKYNDKSLRQRTVDSWSGKYLNGVKVQVINVEKGSELFKLSEQHRMKSLDKSSGFMDKLNGKYYIVLIKENNTASLSLGVLAHEFGHALQRVAFDTAPKDVQDKLYAQHALDMATVTDDPTKLSLMMSAARAVGNDEFAREVEEKLSKEMSEEEREALIQSFMDRGVARQLKGLTQKRADYLFSFEEWFAEQFSKYVTGNMDRTINAKERSMWEKLQATMKRFFNELVRQYQPNTEFKRWVESLVPANKRTAAQKDESSKSAPSLKQILVDVRAAYKVDATSTLEQFLKDFEEKVDAGKVSPEKLQSVIQLLQKAVAAEQGWFKTIADLKAKYGKTDPNLDGEAASGIRSKANAARINARTIVDALKAAIEDGKGNTGSGGNGNVGGGKGKGNNGGKGDKGGKGNTGKGNNGNNDNTGKGSNDANDAARKKFVEIVRSMVGHRIAVKFDQKLTEGVKGSYVTKEEALETVRNKRIAELNKEEPDMAKVAALEKKEKEIAEDKAILGIIRVAAGAEEQFGLAEHETFHGAFHFFFNNEEHRILATAFSRGIALRQLKNHFKDQPWVLDAIERDPEEAAAYGFQLWMADPSILKVGNETRNLFEKFKAWLRSLFGVLTAEQKADIILRDLRSGKRAETEASPIAKVLDKDLPWTERAQKFAQDIGGLVDSGRSIVLSSVYQRLVDTENPMLKKIADLGYQPTGADGNSGGMIQRQMQEEKRQLNRLAEIYGNLTPEELSALQDAGVYDKAPTNPKLKEIWEKQNAWYKDMLGYQRDANVDVKDAAIKSNYRPLSWDAEKVYKNKDAFMAMLDKYADELETLKKTKLMIWEDIVSYLERGEQFTDVMDSDNEPVAGHTKTRSLAFISREDRRAFMGDDPRDAAIQYAKQAIRQAEYVRSFGRSGVKLNQMKTEAIKKYGATPEQIALTNDYIDGLMGNKEIGMSRELKDLYGSINVYQSYRLLPFSLFSSLVDPLGIAVRSNSVTDAWETFTYSMRNLFKEWKGTYTKDQWEQIAEDWGYIQSVGVMDNVDHLYTGITLRGTTRKMNDALFKYNLLSGWIRNNTIMAVKAAQKFIYRSSEGFFGDEASARYLEELGLSKEDILYDSKSERILLRAEELEAAGMTKDKAAEVETKLRNAIGKFVRQALLNPSSAEMPNWMSNPYMMPIAQLKQFVFAFNATIVDRVIHEYGHGNIKPALVAAGYVPGMIAADFIKDMISNAGDEPPYKKEWGAYDYVRQGVLRSGLTGTGQFFTDAKEDIMRGGTGLEGMAGPTLEQVKKGVKAFGSGDDESIGKWILKSMPLNAVYDQWWE